MNTPIILCECDQDYCLECEIRWLGYCKIALDNKFPKIKAPRTYITYWVKLATTGTLMEVSPKDILSFSN